MRVILMMTLMLALLSVTAMGVPVAPVIVGEAALQSSADASQQVDPIMQPRGSVRPESVVETPKTEVMEDGYLSMLERSSRQSVPVVVPDASGPTPAGAPTQSAGVRFPRRAPIGAHHGWGISPRRPRRVQQRLPSARLTGAAATLTRANVRCVLCQFIVQKLKSTLQTQAATPAAPVPPPTTPAATPALLEESADAEPMLLETFSFASAEQQARAESMTEAAATADAAAAALPSLFEAGPDKMSRFRHTDVLAHRASRARFTQVRANQGEVAEAQRAAYRKLYASLYASFESLCTTRMPLAYLPYCNDMLKSYRFFAQGINFGDRADQICMNGNFCDHRSYVRTVTHASYQREPGDA